MENQELLELLTEFFKNVDINKRDVLSKNPVAKLLKQELSAKGRWKNLPRGKPISY